MAREYCNPNPLYGDQGFGELSCESYEPRTQEPEVYATVGNSLFGTVERLVCAQNVATAVTLQHDLRMLLALRS